MLPLRCRLISCLSVLLAAGALSSPTLAQSTQNVTLKDFQVQSTETGLPLTLFHDFDIVFLRFCVQKNFLRLVQWKVSDGNMSKSLILPDGTLTYQPQETLLWSGPLDEPALFTLRSGKDGPILEDANNEALTLPYTFHPDPFQAPPDTICHISLTGEVLTIEVSEREYATTRMAWQPLGSSPAMALNMTVEVNKSRFDMPLTVLDVQAPAVPGTYLYTFRDAAGTFIASRKTDVLRRTPDQVGNTFHQPFEADEYTSDANGNLASDPSRIYFLGPVAQVTPAAPQPPAMAAPPRPAFPLVPRVILISR